MLKHSLMLGMLRVSARSTHFPPNSLHSLCARQLSTSRTLSRTSTLLNYPQRTPTLPLASIFTNRRLLSLGSIFTRRKPEVAPTPQVVAHITRLEAEANVHPHDLSKQLALFQALVDTKLKSSYDLVISRWERMCEFDPSSPLLHSTEAFKLYLTSLLNTGQQAAFNSAVRRRDSLLAAHPAPSLPISNSSTAEAAPLNSVSGTEATPLTSASGTVAAPLSSLSGTETAHLVQPDRLKPNTSASVADAVLTGGTSTATSSNASVAKLLEKGHEHPIEVTIVDRKGNWIPGVIKFFVSAMFYSFVFLVIVSIFLDSAGYMKSDPQKLKFEPKEGSIVKFSDVHGVDEAKDELQDVVAFLKDPASFATLGGKLPKGVLLTGPPGTGKTMLARAVAGEAGVPFFSASGSEFEEIYVGVGAKRVRELFAAARKKEPSIIFIDELDAVGGKRNARDQQHLKQTLNQLLVEMDGFQQSEGVIVIAATNFPQSLDKALTRPGRFDRIIAVPLPDVRGRVQILQHHMRGVTTAEDADPKILARGTPGFSGADLQNMVNQAAIHASKEKAKAVTLKHFEWAKDRIVMGAERKSHYIAPKEKLATAYHEGGHTIVALYTEGATPLHKVTCVPRGHALGYTSLLPEDDQNSMSLKQYLASIDVSMGGRIAEELIYGEDNVTSGASSDIQNATTTARAMVKYWGFSSLGPIYYGDRNDLSSQRLQDIENEVAKIVRGGEARATALLKDKLDELHKLAHALVEHETLDSDEVKRVIKGEPIRNITQILEEAEAQTD